MTTPFQPTRRAVSAMLLASALPPAFAQGAPDAPAPKAPAWPTRPLRLLVGFPPGSVQDLSARAIAEPLGKALGQPVIVENKAGASGTIAADLVSKAIDEHTFGVMNNSQLTIARMLNPAVNYDPERDLTPVALIGTTPLLLVVGPSAPGRMPQELLGWLRNLGPKGNYGSPGTGTPGHLGMELFKSRAGIDTMHVPYPGNPQVITAIMGGQLQAGLMPPGLVLPHIRAGRLKAVAVTSERRSLLAPDVPTMREAGVSGAEVELFTAVAGPRKLSPAIRDRLGAAVIAAVKADETRQHLLTAGWQATPSNHDGLRLRQRDDLRSMGGIITMRRIRADA